MGEALARCPRLALVPPDPAGVADAWEALLARAGGDRRRRRARSGPGSRASPPTGLRRPARRQLDGVLAAAARALRAARADRRRARRASARSPRASRARSRRPESCDGGGRALRPGAARGRACCALRERPPALRRAARAARGRHARRAGRAAPRRGGRPLRPAGAARARPRPTAHDAPLRPRGARRALREALELPEAASGPQLEHALGLLVDRLLARRERRGRTLRAVALSARARRGRDVARARRLPRGARRPGADAARARRAPASCCPRRPRRCG